MPPLLFIYIIPAVLSNTGVMTNESPVYGWMSSLVLPLFLVMLLLGVDVRSAVRVMGRGIFVMLVGTLGVMIGAPLGYLLVKSNLGFDAWKGFGALAGSWIGGTGNMAAVAEALGTSGTDFGLAVIADNGVYLLWLPLLLTSRNLAKWFHRFTGVSDKRLERLQNAAAELKVNTDTPAMRHYLYLIFLGLVVTAIATVLSRLVPDFVIWLRSFAPQAPFLYGVQEGLWRAFIEMPVSAWRILLITTFGITLHSPERDTFPALMRWRWRWFIFLSPTWGHAPICRTSPGRRAGSCWVLMFGSSSMAASFCWQRGYSRSMSTPPQSPALQISGAQPRRRWSQRTTTRH